MTTRSTYCIKLFLLFGLIFSFSFVNAQKVDSLKNVLKTQGQDTARVTTLANLAWELYLQDKYDESLPYIQEGIALGEKLQHRAELANLLRRSGDYYKFKQDYPKAIAEYKRALNLEEEDKRRNKMASTHNKLAKLYIEMGELSKAAVNLEAQLSINRDIKDTVQIANVLFAMWDLYYKEMKDAPKAAEYLEQAQSLVSTTSNDSILAYLYNKIGSFYSSEGDYEKAAEYLNKGLNLHEEQNNLKEMASDYFDIGSLYEKSGNYHKSLEYSLKILKIREKLGDKSSIALAYNNAGWGYQLIGDFEKALEYQLKAYKFYTEAGDDISIAYPIGNLGIIYNQLGSYDKAIEYSLKAKDLFEKSKDLGGIAEAYNNIGSAYVNKGDYSKATEYLKKGLDLATKENVLFEIKNSYAGLSQCYEKLGDFKRAYENYKLFTKIRDTIVNQENSDRVSKMHFSIENEKNQKALELQNKTIQLNEAELKTQRTFLYSAIAGVLLVLLLLFFVLRGYSQKKKSSELLGSQKAEIEKAYHNTKLLSEIGREISASLSVEKIIQNCYKSLNTLMDASSFWIGIYNEDNQSLDYPMGIEKGQILPFASYSLSEDDRLPVWAFKNRQEVMVNDYIRDYQKYIPSGRAPKPVVGDRPESSMWLPLISKDNRVMGILTIQSFEKEVYTDYHLSVARSLAVFTAVALENALLYEEVERKVKERTAEVVKQKEEIENSYRTMKLLSDIGRDITASLQVEEIIGKVYKNVNTLMDAPIFLIGIHDADKHQLFVPGAIEKNVRQPLYSYDLKDKHRPAVLSFESQKEVIMNDFKRDFNKYFPNVPFPAPVSGETPESLIYIPLTTATRKIGVLSFQSFKKDAYQEYQMDIIRTLAIYVSTALENARLYGNMEAEVKERTVEIVKQKEELEQQNAVISEKNKHITDSINYAKRIQDAILPTTDTFKSMLPDAFVLYRPKDIVSGDFYWMTEKAGKLFFAVVDCTGHGVPGAFVSIIGYNGLYRSVNEFGLTKPSEILDKLNELVEETFEQNNQASQIKDGMDIALCSYDPKTRTLEYSGANNPLYIISGTELNEIKGDKQPIGAFDHRKKFTNHTLTLKKDDSIYIFSDGYADQFGGVMKKKFKYNQFKTMLSSMNGTSMNQQREILNHTITTWMGDLEQVDDICVIGVRV